MKGCDIMYKIGDLFIYGTSGACKIIEIKEEKFSTEVKTYYILAPVNDLKSTIFVPVDNEKLVSKMKKILNEDELMSLIKSIPNMDNIWIENINIRREEYKKIINSNERTKILSLLKTLYERKQNLADIGKKLSVYDEKFLHQAQKIIHSEVAAVFNMNTNEVEPMIKEAINAA